MNNMKKFASILLALVMVLAMAAPAMAESGETDTYTLTLNNAIEGHTYTAYQIFAGDLSNGVLSNIVWGSGVNTEAEGFNMGDAAAKAETIKQVSDAEAFAAAIAPYLSTPAGSVTIVEGATSGEIKDLEAGYYLVKTTRTATDTDVYTYYVMVVVEDTNANLKADVPEVEKTVNDNDANIGDTVTFTLTATMPNNIQGYETYKVVFHDTMSKGLDFVEGSVKVTIDGADKTSAFTVVPGNYAGTGEDDAYVGGSILTITCDDVLEQGATANSKIVVTYNATVTADAVIGVEGNPNKVKLEYSNNPNGDGTGNTPEEEVKVYTWEIPVFKYTGTNTPLAGAGFTLYTDANCTTAVNLVATTGSTIYKVCTQTECSDHKHVTEIITGDTGKFEVEGLQKGTYYLKETTTPDGYNTCDVVTVVIGENGALTMNGEATEEVDIENKAGSTLPETGGMGTTVIYVAGGLLVAAAVILMVSKRRRAA